MTFAALALLAVWLAVEAVRTRRARAAMTPAERAADVARVRAAAEQAWPDR